MSIYWQQYYDTVDTALEENFWGNLSIYKKSEDYGDPYIEQMKHMGYCIDPGNEHPSPFAQSIAWIVDQIKGFIDTGIITQQDAIWPSKAFIVEEDVIFVRFGDAVPENAKSINLLRPCTFVKMLAQGHFPIGDAIRKHTNQTMAEHDLAHMAGFVSSPEYMSAVRKAFGLIVQKMEINADIATALEHFDSVYSLRLYYLIEVFTEIRPEKRDRLEELIELPLSTVVCKENIVTFLQQKAEKPSELYKYLSRLYLEFHTLVNAVGGESRDMLNRRRKFKRGDQLGTFYESVSTLTSKYNGNSIWAMFLNAKAALENKRSNHNDFWRAIEEIHAPFIGAIIGTSQMNTTDWILEASNEVVSVDSKLYKYIHNSGFWDKRHAIYWAHCCEDYTYVLTEEDMIQN